MRTRGLILTLALLAGCDRSVEKPDEKMLVPAAVSFDGADVRSPPAHGERLTYVLGCRGCHGKELQGKPFYDVYASNLTRDIAGYKDAQLSRLLREGVRPSGRDVWAMPSELFQHLSQPDEAALIAYLRTLKPAGPPTATPPPLSAETQQLIAEGELKPAAAYVREQRNIGPVELGPSHALGRYITRVTCAECHGPELEGGKDTPDLIAAGAYSREEFEKLIVEGVPTGKRELRELMQSVARNRFSHLTPHERDALYAYLTARAERPQ